jgi:hypothetical protein
VPLNRQSDFAPQIVKKRQKDISGLEEKIVSMYAKGMTTRDIQDHIKDLIPFGATRVWVRFPPPARLISLECQRLAMSPDPLIVFRPKP